MTRLAGFALLALMLVGGGGAGALHAQDTTRAQDTLAVPRHLLSLDLSRVHPFRRSYDMLARVGDSVVVLGTRTVALDSADYAGAPAWLLIETRAGVVPAVESLYLAPDLRPIHWSSALGRARLGAEFVGDSVYGAATLQQGKQNLLAPVPPDVLVSLAMAELLAPLLPLAPEWSDSLAALQIDLVANRVLPVQAAVVDRLVTADPALRAPSWLLELRADSMRVLLTVDVDAAAVTRVVQDLPRHVGRDMVYRAIAEPASPEPP